MKKHTGLNIFMWLLIPWIGGWAATLATTYWVFFWWATSADRQQADNWAVFLRDIFDHEVDSCKSIVDVKDSNVLHSFVNRYQLEFALFSPSGDCLVSSRMTPPATLLPEGHDVLKTGKVLAKWIEDEKIGRRRLMAIWSGDTSSGTYVAWVSIYLPVETPWAYLPHSTLVGGLLAFALGIPVAGLMARLSKRGLEAAKKSILEGSPTSNRWELREWQLFTRELKDYLGEQRQQMEVLQRIALDHQTTLQNLADGLLYVTREGRVVKHNPAAARLLRLPIPSAEGVSLRECFRHPELLLWAEKLMALQHPQELFLHSEELGQHLEIRGNELKAPDNRVRGFLIIIRDMTRAWQADRVRRDFVANVSHELRTPLTSMKGFLETLLDGAIDDPAQAIRFVKIVHEQTERLESIVNDLLTLARLESESEQPIARESVRVDELVAGVVDACRLLAEQRSMRIHCETPNDLIVNVNSRLFHQALVNLLDNAIKYSDPGKEIRISVRREAAEVIFEVEDQGWGIEARHLPRIFERFYRVDPSRSRQLGGTGLGLAIVKHVAQIHGGRVTVDSRVGVGTIFRIYLPERLIVATATGDESSR
jgi:signal transduction histidine kinase